MTTGWKTLIRKKKRKNATYPCRTRCVNGEKKDDAETEQDDKGNDGIRVKVASGNKSWHIDKRLTTTKIQS